MLSSQPSAAPVASEEPAERCAARAPGRPRDEKAGFAIVAATLELLAEVGPTGLSVEEVASRAGVGKATIYRRFATKDDLVVAALASLNELLPSVSPEGPVRDALVQVVTSWWDRYDDSQSGRLFPRVFAHARTNPRMFGSFYDTVIEPRRELFRSAIRAGIAAGELRPDTDVELLTTMLIATTLYMLQIRASGRDAAPGSGPAQLVDAAIAGFLPV
jgi:AcrR family transcriptional regulator